MRKLAIIGLIATNAILAVMLVGNFLKPETAHAQPMGMSGNVLMTAGAILGTTSDAVYVVDLTNRELLALIYDKSKIDEVSILGRRDLVRDLAYGATTEEEPDRRRRRR